MTELLNELLLLSQACYQFNISHELWPSYNIVLQMIKAQEKSSCPRD